MTCLESPIPMWSFQTHLRRALPASRNVIGRDRTSCRFRSQSRNGQHFGEHVQKPFRKAVDGVIVRIVTRRRCALLRGRGWISQLVECGGQPTDIVDISRRKARGLVFGEAAGHRNDRRDAQLHRQNLHPAL